MATPETKLGVLLLSAARHQNLISDVLSRQPRVRLVAVADEPGAPSWVREANRQLAEKWGLPYTEDVDAALARSDVDLVSICPEYIRFSPLIVKALRADKHVLVDKQPLGMTVEEGEAVYAAAREAVARGKKLTWFHHSLDKTVVRARRLVDSGQIGEPRSVYVSVLCSYGPGDDRDLSPNSRYVKGFHPQYWGGGELIHHGAYGIGVARHVMGSEVTSVYAVLGCFFNYIHREFGIDDLATLSLSFANGGVGTVVVGRAPNQSSPSAGDHFVRLVGTRGAITADFEGPSFQLCDSKAGLSQRQGYSPDAYTTVTHQFVEALLEGGEPVRGYQDALPELHVLLGAGRSAREGRAIALPLTGSQSTTVPMVEVGG